MARITPLIGLAVALLAGCGDDREPNATITNFCLKSINGTPGPPGPYCPTPTWTPDGNVDLHVSCAVTPGETVVIDGTPYVVIARACTPTPTPE